MTTLEGVHLQLGGFWADTLQVLFTGLVGNEYIPNNLNPAKSTRNITY